MKKIVWLVILSLLVTPMGCAYEATYRAYADAQARMSVSNGPLVELYPDGKLKSVGNPMNSVAMMQMKSPKSDWDGLWDVLRIALPFAAIYGIVGAMSTANHGNTTTTNVGGANNLVGNTSSGGSILSSPPTTTTTTTTGLGKLPDGLIVE